jgi:hypothetical protein
MTPEEATIEQKSRAQMHSNWRQLANQNRISE